MLRLQQILIGREQGLALEEIRRSLDDPRFDRKQALLAQKRELQKRAQQTAEMILAIGFHPSPYEAEAQQRWGHTDAYKESVKRTQRYTAEDWQRFQAEQAAIYDDAFAALKAGSAPDSVEAMDIGERHWLAIDRWFYPCSFAIHVGLADGYEADSRFSENIDKFGAGLTPFLSAAIRANARRSCG